MPSAISHDSDPASYPVLLGVPNSDADHSALAQAREAIRAEYSASVRWMKLRCRAVHRTADPTIFRLEAGAGLEFDWSWEGATAFRPRDLDRFETGVSESDVWRGEVVEVDEASGHIYVWVEQPESLPHRGWFYVSPFEFLAGLDSIYNGDDWQGQRSQLAPRLAATRGGIHPPTQGSVSPCLPDLSQMWGHAWSILWGPPGTGKTYTVGQQVAASFADGTERIFVVSTTNKSTDGSAMSIGNAVRSRDPAAVDRGQILRIGKGARLHSYRDSGLEGLLAGTETLLMEQVDQRSRELDGAADPERKARLRKEVQELRRAMKDASLTMFASAQVRVVVTTAFKALALLNQSTIRTQVGGGRAPFTTVFIDEAGLISRAALAALSLLASRRVVLVGDPKQLAPITRLSRVLPPFQLEWLGSSGLSHLTDLSASPPAVHLLRQQYRMHPSIRKAVSQYQYAGQLHDAPPVQHRPCPETKLLDGQPRAIWYVLDEDGKDYPAIRAKRGPSGRSWMRAKTRAVLDKLFSDDAIRKLDGLFITPFVAQAADIREYFHEQKLEGWSAASVHSQQGAEATVVIFDTVHAGSTAWPAEEWKRLVNVGLSRAKEFVILLASRAEMREEYLAPLVEHLAARVIRGSGGVFRWLEVEARITFTIPQAIADNPALLGNQIAARRSLRPVLSADQQRLCGYEMDGKPRLVRGVAGSGKTVVLANWLVQTLRLWRHRKDLKIWVVFANRSLSRLISDTIMSVLREEGEDDSFPHRTVQAMHILDVFTQVDIRCLDEAELDYDAAVRVHFQRTNRGHIVPCCDAIFVDEAQDMGPSALQLLSLLVKPTDEMDEKSRPINIFYDNAQNLYGRRTPNWASIGLDMKGRSTVMRESFRSTKPILEFALNVLCQLDPDQMLGDHGELVARDLVREGSRGGVRWWEIRYNQIHGPNPSVLVSSNKQTEIAAITDQLVSWIQDQGVHPNDICLIYNGKEMQQELEETVNDQFRGRGLNVRIEVQTGVAFSRDQNTVIATTPQSFKGYEAEVVLVAGADAFVTKTGEVLASSLYVAMTRARSVLAVFATRRKKKGQQIVQAVEECLRLLQLVPALVVEDVPPGETEEP